jgi:hypothetical protein
MDGVVEGEDPLGPFPATAGAHLLRSDDFRNALDIWVNSVYDPALDEVCDSRS